MKVFNNKELSASELSFFCMQISLILKSGMVIHDGIDWMYNDMQDSRIKKVIGDIKKELSNNEPLYEAMGKTEYFPDFLINMCQIGSLTGRLDDVMTSLSEYYDREGYLKSKLKNAIFYPALLFVMMSAIIVLLVLKIFPIFENMLMELGGDVNSSNLISFSTGVITGKITMAAVIVILFILIFLSVLYKTNRGKKIVTNLFGKFIGVKSIIKKITAYRFSYSMSLLLSSGMTIEKSIDTLSETINNVELKNIISNIKNEDDFAVSLSKLSVFSSMHIQMLKMGQSSGELDDVMKKLTTIYENEADESINNAVSLIEPMLVGFLSIVIGSILISVMLPLINIMSSIG